jgi:hypothetical protein
MSKPKLGRKPRAAGVPMVKMGVAIQQPHRVLLDLLSKHNNQSLSQCIEWLIEKVSKDHLKDGKNVRLNETQAMQLGCLVIPNTLPIDAITVEVLEGGGVFMRSNLVVGWSIGLDGNTKSPIFAVPDNLSSQTAIEIGDSWYSTTTDYSLGVDFHGGTFDEFRQACRDEAELQGVKT